MVCGTCLWMSIIIMFELFIRNLIHKLIDWLVVFLGVVFILWFAFTAPIFSWSQTKHASTDISLVVLKSHVSALIHDFAPRTIEYGNLNITAHYIYDQLKRFGSVKYQPYSTLGGRFSNVELELGPDTKEVFVIGAHYDAENDSLDVDGNASGIATLIELAHQLSKSENKLPIRVILVAYPLSQGYSAIRENMGSYNHAKSLLKKNKKVRLMVSLDGVGSFNDEEKSQKYPYKFLSYIYPTKGNYIGVVARLQDYEKVRAMKKSFVSASPLPVYSFNVPERFELTSSQDHLNYQRLGFPAVLVTDTAKYRDKKPHIEDIVDRLDYEKIAMLIKGLYQVVMDSKAPNRETEMIVDQRYGRNSPLN